MNECEYCETCTFGAGKCHCGCGEDAPIRKWSSRTSTGKSLQAGMPVKFLVGHHRRKATNKHIKKLELARQLYLDKSICPHCELDCKVGVGNCHCGCGEYAPIYHEHKNDYEMGYMQGMPLKYRKGHRFRRLTTEQAREIRHRYASDESLTQVSLAQEYGVAQRTISRVVLFDSHKEAGV